MCHAAEESVADVPSVVAGDIEGIGPRAAGRVLAVIVDRESDRGILTRRAIGWNRDVTDDQVRGRDVHHIDRLRGVARVIVLGISLMHRVA